MRAREREGRGKNQHGSCRVWNQTAVSSLWKGAILAGAGMGREVLAGGWKSSRCWSGW